MPLIIMVGLPCCGKSTRAEEIKTALEQNYSKKVQIISENQILKNKNLDKNAFYMNSHKEKEVRGILKSNALRELTQDGVVILDGCNYIKGYRYEIYCAVKNSKTTQLTVECLAHGDTCWSWNTTRSSDSYTREVFDALGQRYEPPDSRNRWDSPLLSLQSGDTVDPHFIHDLLFKRKPPPPNQSTQCAPLSSSDFLHQLDQITQQVVQEILERKRTGGEGAMKIGESYLEEGGKGVTPAVLARYRRQFLNYTKLHPPSSSADTPQQLSTLFVSYLNTSLNSD